MGKNITEKMLLDARRCGALSCCDCLMGRISGYDVTICVEAIATALHNERYPEKTKERIIAENLYDNLAYTQQSRDIDIQSIVDALEAVKND